MDLSVVVPLFDEEDNVHPLIDAVRSALTDGTTWELVLVDDGSRDATRERIRQAAAGDERVRLVALVRNYGQSTAMQAGFDHSRGEVVVTMDGDLQNDPRDIPRVVRKLDEGYDLVAGYRVHRQDRLLTRKVPSWVANRLIRTLTGVPIRDNGCSVKAYNRELLDRMRLYSDMHRFIPALAVGTAGARVAEIPVQHHPRRYGRSKYGLSRIVKVLADLLTIKMIRSFRLRPLRLAAGACVMSLGVASAFALLALFIYAAPGTGSATVFTGVSLVFASLGVFLLLLGLAAEVAVRHRGTAARGRSLVREWYA